MIQNVLRALGGVEIYGVLSICLFFATFSGAVIWAMAQSKRNCSAASALPLERDEKGRDS